MRLAGTGQLPESQPRIKKGNVHLQPERSVSPRLTTIQAMIKKSMPVCNQREGRRLVGIVHDRHVLPEDMGDDLVPEGEERQCVGTLILMKMERGNLKEIIPLRADLLMGDAFEIQPDLEHQPVEMQQLVLLHAVTVTDECQGGYRRSWVPGRGCRTG
jgi:hypothetical protein